MLRIGRFTKFKGQDTALLSGDADDIASLTKQLAMVVGGSLDALLVHDLAQVSPTCELELIAARSIPGPIKKDRHYWRCDAALLDNLSSLTTVSSGHQYFDIAGSEAVLLVSVGEYDADWWQKNG
jgi:hypothetical protein